jgi:hypothetical protein
MVEGSCLCGDVAWRSEGPVEWLHHCHCSLCRKAHGTAFASYFLTPREGYRLLRGEQRVVGYGSSKRVTRQFCGRCGSALPEADDGDGAAVIPAGPCDGDLGGARPEAHIFVASKAPWSEIPDALPRFFAFPPGIEAPVLTERPAATRSGRLEGSCLCGAVGYAVEGEIVRVTNCHCGRCRKARGAAHGSNLFTRESGLRFTRGAERLVSYKVPEARYYTQVFCRDCGGKLPRLDSERKLAVVPMGSLDDDPGVRPTAHIYVASKAPWYEIVDGLPRHPEGLPAA